MTVLNSIIAGVLEDLAKRKMPDSQLAELISAAPATRSALHSLRSRSWSLIAEVKRSSPSKGALAPIPEPERLAAKYESAGAAVVSVLTEQQRFGGSLADLSAVRNAINIPILRKDFIVNEYMVRETRAYGADLLLLIVAGLEKSKLYDLYHLANSIGLEVLVEIHDQSELEIALELNPQIIGVNSRNLKTLEIDIENFTNLIPLIPDSIYRIAESGISSQKDAQIARDAGADAILVGESLVKSGQPEDTIANFLNIAKTI